MEIGHKSARDRHTPVLLNTCLDLLAPAFDVPKPLMVDATLGLGGHTEAALERFPSLRVIGIDRDPQALELARIRLEPFGDRFRPFLGTYDQIDQAVGNEKADGILMDLGVSSMQLDESERGFAYSIDAPLDMRMDPTGPVTAADLLNEASEEEITRILWEGADEKFARKIARNIVLAREKKPLERTGELAQIVADSIPAPARRTGGHPAKRTFQAVRIAVNNELRILEEALPTALASLRVGGRIVVMSYQSLEDKIVKKVFAKGAVTRGAQLPAGVPVMAAEADKGRRLTPLTRGAVKAEPEEISANKRASSVRLRAAELSGEWSKNVS